jgi:hypothetical protein
LKVFVVNFVAGWVTVRVYEAFCILEMSRYHTGYADVFKRRTEGIGKEGAVVYFKGLVMTQSV